jgi:hypothetical protein
MICDDIKFLIGIILPMFVSSYCFAQSDSAPTFDSSNATSVQDSAASDSGLSTDTAVTRTIFNNDNDSVLKWKNRPGFEYMAYLDSLLRQKKNELKSDTFHFNNNGSKGRSNITSAVSSSNSFLNSVPVKIFFWALAIFFIVFILYKLFVSGGLFTRDNLKQKAEPPDEEPEKLSEYSVYNELIYDAESKNNFNSAIRYLYLQVLKKLSERELILFSPGKTNLDYIHELSGKDYQQDFISLTHNYEYAWYGKFFIDHNSYQNLKHQFILFNKKV